MESVDDFSLVCDMVAALGEQQLLDSEHCVATVDLLRSLQPLFAKLSGYAPFGAHPKSQELCKSLHSSVVEVGRSVSSCFVSQRNAVADHEVVKCVLLLNLAVRTFVSQVFKILGVQYEGVPTSQECDMKTSGSRLPYDLDGCSLYQKFSRSMDCFGKLGKGNISLPPDLQTAGMDWQQESVLEDCQTVAEDINRNLQALDSNVTYMKTLLASTAHGIEEVLVSRKRAPPFVVMAQLRHKVQVFLNHRLAATTDKQERQEQDVSSRDLASTSEEHPSRSGAEADDVAKPVEAKGGEGGMCALKQQGPPDEALSCQADVLSEDVEQVKGKLLSRNGPMLVAIQGKASLGKTSVAALTCCTEAVMDRFLGGTYWVSLGRFPDLISLQNNLLEDITGFRERVESVEDGLARLAQELALRLPSLLVIDDVWKVEHLNAFTVYEDNSRGKYLVTLQDISLLDGAHKDEFVLLPRREQQAADIFVSILRGPTCPRLEYESDIAKCVNACSGVPLLLHALSSSICEKGDVSSWEKLPRIARNLETYERTVNDTSMPPSAQSQEATCLLNEHTTLCSPDAALSPEQEGLLRGEHAADEEDLRSRQDVQTMQLREGETEEPDRLKGLPKQLSVKNSITDKEKVFHDGSQDQNLEVQDSSVTRQQLLPLLFCFDSLSAVHPVLLDRYLDLAAFPKGEYISTGRIENIWGTGRVLNHCYTLITLSLFASRALLQWRYEYAPLQVSPRNTGYSLYWRLPAVFHDLAQLVIQADNAKIVDLHNLQENDMGGSAVDHRKSEIQEHTLAKSLRSQDSSERYDWEDMFERICYVDVTNLGSKKPGILEEGASFSNEGWTSIRSTMFAKAAAASEGTKRNETGVLEKGPRMSPLRCRLFSPGPVQDRFPGGWDVEPVASHAEKLSLDRTKVSHFPESFSYPILRIALMGNNATLRQIPSHVFVRMQSLLVLELKGCRALMSIPKAIASLQSLKLLDLSDCSRLQFLPTSIGQLKNLREFRVARCTFLGCLPQSVSCLTNLELFDLSSCSKLRYLPTSLGSLSSLRSLNLKGCSSLRSLPISISSLTKLIEIDMTRCSSLQYTPSYLNQLRLLANNQKVGAMAVPPGLWKLPNLEVLQLSSATHVTFLPSTIAGLRNLRLLNLSGCRTLEYLPQEVGSLTLLENLDLSCTALRKLPASLGSLNNLRTLSLRECPRLLSIPPTLSSLSRLQSLDLSHCWDLIVIPPSIGEPNSLKELSQLDMAGCSFQSLPALSVGACAKLKKLNLSDCVNLTCLPPTIKVLKSLEILYLDGCRSLQSLKDLGLEDLSSLSYLSLRNCTAMTFLPGPELLQLRYLDVSGCPVTPFPVDLLAQAKDRRLKLIRWGAIWQG